MPCHDCGPSPLRVTTGESRTYSFPLKGLDLQITVRGDVTPATLPLVKQCLSVTYDALEDLSQETPHARPR